MKNNICPLCKREFGLKEYTSKHHLIPKSKGGKYTDTVVLHSICHRKIHSVFTENELNKHYNTIERIAAQEDMAKFIKWVAKKHPDFYEKSRDMNKKK